MCGSANIIARRSLGDGPERRQARQQRRHALGENRIGRHGGQLLLPKLDIPAGERGEIGRFPHGAQYRRIHHGDTEDTETPAVIASAAGATQSSLQCPGSFRCCAPRDDEKGHSSVFFSYHALRYPKRRGKWDGRDSCTMLKQYEIALFVCDDSQSRHLARGPNSGSKQNRVAQ